MDIEHITIYKGTDHHSAFPEIIRLQNGELITVFRQAPVRAGTGVHKERNAKVTHFHQDTSSRAAGQSSPSSPAVLSRDSSVITMLRRVCFVREFQSASSQMSWNIDITWSAH